jgi:hypothetical protein
VREGSLENHAGARPARRWDSIAAIVAALIGLMALAVSGYTAYIQRQQVRAQVWPYLLVGNYDPESAMKVLNKGVGPALVRSVRMFVDDKPQADWKHVLAALDIPNDGLQISTLSNNVLSAGESMTMIKLADADTYKRFRDAARVRATMEICFCSTLGECWLYSDRTPGERPTQRPVEQCRALRGDDAFND